MVFGSHEYRPIYRIEASAAKAMRPILTRELPSQLILGILYTPNTLLSLLHCDVYVIQES